MSDVVFQNPIAANYATGETAVDDQFHNVVVEGVGEGRHWKRTSMPLFGMRAIHRIGDYNRLTPPIVVGNNNVVQTFHKLDPFPPDAMLKFVFHDNNILDRPWEAAWIDVKAMMDNPTQSANILSFGGDDAFVSIRVTNAHDGTLIFFDAFRDAAFVESSLWSVPDLRHSYL